jgi:hypothetical protein
MNASLLQREEMGPVAGVAGAHRRCLRIGDVTVGVTGAFEGDVSFDDRLSRFRAEVESCDVNIRVQWTGKIDRHNGRMLFDSGSVWKAFEDGESLVFDFTTPFLGASPYRRLRITRDFGDADLLLNRELLSGHQQGFFPLEYPLDELLIMHRLTRVGGVELHGCGFVDSERGGYLFLGHSGAGKSTTMNLWRSRRNVTVLSDDRIVVRKRDGGFWIYGTPWHGEPGLDDQGKARIDKIFILEHGTANEITRLSQSEAAGELIARSFVPFYDHEYLTSAVNSLHEVAESLPCYRYRFVPDASALEKVLNRD